MRNIYISDNTLRHTGVEDEEQLSFRLKLEIAKQLDKLGVTAIETLPILDSKSDYFLVKSIASAVKSAQVAVPVDILNPDGPALSWDALKDARHPRLQVHVPASTVQMEYFCHKKPSALISMIGERVAACVALCDNVEFIAHDFTRSETDILHQMIDAAVNAGAKIITVSDSAGNLLPDEFFKTVKEVREYLPEGITLGVQCSNEIHLADACGVAAVRAGADEIKTAVLGRNSASLLRLSRIISAKSDFLDAGCGIKMTEVEHVYESIREMCKAYKKNPRMVSLGAEEPAQQEADETEAVPETYRMESYLINSGNIISATCHLRLIKDGELLESVCVGNGPVDAAFQAMEKVLGVSYELDDFKIRSVTEGSEAVGETVVMLRHEGKIYSGKGVSTDIVGSSILAYLNAVNKIAYEEEKA